MSSNYWQPAAPKPKPETWRVHARLTNGRIGAWEVPKDEATWDEAIGLVMSQPNVRVAIVRVQ